MNLGMGLFVGAKNLGGTPTSSIIFQNSISHIWWHSGEGIGDGASAGPDADGGEDGGGGEGRADTDVMGNDRGI